MSALEETINKLDEEIAFLKEKRDELKELNGTANYKIESAAEIFERVKAKPVMPKIMTGVNCIDANMGGLELGTFINIAGEAGAGKTTLLLKILTNLAEGHKVLFFSYEMYEDRLKRAIEKLTNNYLSYQNLLIEQKRRNIKDIEKIITAKAKEGVKLFVIDSIMKLESYGDGINEKRAFISATLAKLTQSLGVIIILINQISKSDMKEKRVDFKGSGDIAYDSDINFFINVRRDKDGTVTGRQLSCTKNRDGNYFSALIPTFYSYSNEQKYDFSGVPK